MTYQISKYDAVKAALKAEEANNILSGIKNGNFTNEFSLSDAIGKFSRGKKTPMTSLRDTEEQIEIKI